MPSSNQCEQASFQFERPTWASYIVFPFMLGLGLFITWYFSNNPYNPISVAIVVSLSAMLIIGLLERIMPYRKKWNQNQGDVLTDLYHTVIHQILLSRGLNILWAECLAMYATFNSIQGLFQHSNINVKLGPLNYFFSMAELHRWHHSEVVKESDHNFGNNLSVWDVVFGSWYLPKDREVGPLGLLNKTYPTGFLSQVKAPFHKKDLSKPIEGEQ